MKTFNFGGRVVILELSTNFEFERSRIPSSQLVLEFPTENFHFGYGYDNVQDLCEFQP